MRGFHSVTRIYDEKRKLNCRIGSDTSHNLNQSSRRKKEQRQQHQQQHQQQRQLLQLTKRTAVHTGTALPCQALRMQ